MTFMKQQHTASWAAAIYTPERVKRQRQMGTRVPLWLAQFYSKALRVTSRLCPYLWVSMAPVQVRRARPVMGSITMMTGKSTRR